MQFQGFFQIGKSAPAIHSSSSCGSGETTVTGSPSAGRKKRMRWACRK